MRVEYGRQSLSEAHVDPDPIRQLTRWIDEAVAAKVNEPNAMTLATCDNQRPTARIVLLKKIDAEGLVFCTNYHSLKGRQLEVNPRAAAVFFWSELERQARVEGMVRRLSEQASAEYFNVRPPGARIAAAASPQSEVIASRAEMEKLYAELMRRYPEGEVPCPTHWGGYLLQPHTIEFWQGGVNRLHDRIEYEWNDQAGWLMHRLAP
jgi:pyridoxamine 5'-phosphate oxidase